MMNSVTQLFIPVRHKLHKASNLSHSALKMSTAYSFAQISPASSSGARWCVKVLGLSLVYEGFRLEWIFLWTTFSRTAFSLLPFKTNPL